MSHNVLEMKNIMKIYPNGIVAVEDVTLELQKGEIHALLGENGAGKSTLMKVLFGLESPEQGQIFLNGEEIQLKSPLEAIKKGIGMVHQHFMLVSSLTVAENIVLGIEPKKSIFVDMNKAIDISKELAKKYNFDIDVTQRVEELPVGIKQKVEILKALYRGADILILDEPTAVLTPQETEELFVQLKKLKELGHTLIFISHKLDEIKSICDRATIMKSGKSKGTYKVSEISTNEMSKLMVGRDVVMTFDKKPLSLKETALKVRNLIVEGTTGVVRVDDLSFDVKQGEIFGIAGVEGNGQGHLVEALTGLTKKYCGDILIFDQNISNKNINEIRKLKVSHIPEDRMTLGCAANMNIMDNLLSNQYQSSEYSGRFMLKLKKIEERVNKLIKEYLIKCKSYKQNVGMLSGGNIQKVVVAREFSTEPKIIIANQPTRGIDVGAASFIRQRIIEFRDAGCAIVLISADLNEVFELSDRLAVMYKGKFSGVFTDVKKLTEEELGKYMLGIKKDEVLEGIIYE
ncbi:ABC transporter ATP-binding protein [Sedimentibacter hydroxybenzoicus DSM 7310]|uniref:ABC transporter ATP-binding protein n=1 Tax=Sedimentibacter hydroxybenzoicus DSM 7310 TaxID=1123245 RepID=A0A974BI98_SEDHY|nr:ABC transporter ATP-binding protein [Sedimentibacter hydroxybenzoicus]NYB73709.1 ABC transporter ATP-binding protein [Sedimentibacter hydroxybenzoicus DSM 7310]